LIIGWEFILTASNFIGIAWWARIETIEPNISYWFGPFLSRNALMVNLEPFLIDISNEKPKSTTDEILKGFIQEPLTTENQNRS